jgi:hypothetical protein
MQAMAAAAMAALVLVGAAGCSGGSSDAGSDGAPKTTQAKPGDAGTRSTDDDPREKTPRNRPGPCDLVPIEKASEILGGESGEPDDSSSSGSNKACTWQTQASIDNPTIDGAGHILTLQVVAPPETMSLDDFWKAGKEQADKMAADKDATADVEGCDDAYWLGGLLSARKDGVYLTGSAGLADDSPAAKAATTALVSTACGSIS